MKTAKQADRWQRTVYARCSGQSDVAGRRRAMPVGLIPPGRTGTEAASVLRTVIADEGKPLYLEPVRGLVVVGRGRWHGRGRWRPRRVLRDELSGVIMRQSRDIRLRA